jgi:hypothetical protein
MLVKAGERTNFGRFGKGIYTSATSSKVRLQPLPTSIAQTNLWTLIQANDYAESIASPFKAMLLNSVVMGRAIKLTSNDESLMKVTLAFARCNRANYSLQLYSRRRVMTRSLVSLEMF